MIKYINKLKYYGLKKCLNIFINRIIIKFGFYKIIYFNKKIYNNPNELQIIQITNELRENRLEIKNLEIDYDKFDDFKDSHNFPNTYYGGVNNKVWEEKILEHWMSSELLNLFKNNNERYLFIDIAASGSPWAKILREKYKNIESYAIDLKINPEYKKYNYYLKQDACKLNFPDNTISGMTLHCAYEMFQYDDDINFISECARVLKPGGKCVILPLYLHIEDCYYATPDKFHEITYKNYNKYIRHDAMNIEASRKYSVRTFSKRILKIIASSNLTHTLFCVKNLKNNLYCNFILLIEKPIK